MNPSRGFALSIRSIDSAPLAFLRALCVIAEGAVVASSAAMNCVAAVLGDPWGRLSVMGGRAGMPRSLGSVLGSAVVRFLGGFRDKESRSIPMRRFGSIAISRDGATLYVSADGVHAYILATGAHLRSVGVGWGVGPLQFKYTRQIWIAPNDLVFVADGLNNRLQILTPQLDFHGFMGARELDCPYGVGGDDTVVAVSEFNAGQIKVFCRSDGALLRCFGTYGRSEGQLAFPSGLCVVNGSRGHCRQPLIAVAERGTGRVTVFCLCGEFLRHIGAGKLKTPYSVACSAFSELLVDDHGNGSVVLFGGDGELSQTIGCKWCHVAIHGDAVFAHCLWRRACVVYT
jgi:hypothetical protein